MLTWLPVALLLTFFGLGMSQTRAASITFDEGPHLAIGYTTLRTGDLRLQPIHIHPPLANVLAASPLLFQDDLPDPRSVNGWQINSLSAVTDAVVWEYPEPARIATAGRVPMLLLGILLCAMVKRWASDVGGARAGLMALGLCALDPNLIAHSALITTDGAAVTLSVATLYVLYRANQAFIVPKKKHYGYLALVGVLLGLAQLTKVSALILVPVTTSAILLANIGRHATPRRALTAGIREGAMVLLIAGLVLWGGYGFEISDVPGLPLRMPAGTHLRIFQSLQEHYDLGHPTFAFGRVSDQGWWWYFPAAFVIKTPLPTLILLALSGLVAGNQLRLILVRRRRTGMGKALGLRRGFLGSSPRGLNALATLAVFPLLYGLSSLFSTVNIGYRHLLPILPFLYIGMAQALSLIQWSKPATARVARGLGVVLYLWLAFVTVRVAPHPLAFFNALVGGPRNGYRYLADSNLDWGQDLWELSDWLRAQGKDRVYYAHYSPANPKVYGVHASFLPPDPRAVAFAPWQPQPGLYAIGATVLQGPYAPDINTYAWFRDQEPVARVGHALFLYDVPSQPPPLWAVVCLPTLTDSEVRKRLGIEEIRLIRPHCEQAWVYPNAEGRGLYVLPASLAAPAGRRLLFTLKNEAGEPTAHIYEIDGTSAVPEHRLVDLVDVDGPLTFVGYSVSVPAGVLEPGALIQLETYWDVVRIPGRPLSLMAHALDDQGRTIAVGDGLGFPIEQWQVGDRIVQRHHLELPETETAAQNLTLQTGGYWLDTMDRWSVDGDASSVVLVTLPVETDN